MLVKFWSKPLVRVSLVMLLAGALYSSWPLGYWLNPGGNRGLASNLEASNQPYNWLFIGLDIASGALVVVVTWWLLRFVRHHNGGRKHWWLEAGIVGVAMFGLFTALDAILPLNCIEGTHNCLPPLQNPYYVVHGFVSIMSIFGLTMSIVVFWWLVAKDNRFFQASRWLLHGLLVIWLCFGVGTLVLVVRDQSSTLSQHVFIILCSLWLVALPYYIWQVLKVKPPVELSIDGDQELTIEKIKRR